MAVEATLPVSSRSGCAGAAAATWRERQTDDGAADHVGGVVDAHVGPREADDRGDHEPDRRPARRPPHAVSSVRREARRRRMTAREARRGRLADRVAGVTVSRSGARGWNSRLMPWLTIRLSSADQRAEERPPARVAGEAEPETAPMTCQIRLKSPRWLARWNNASAARWPRSVRGSVGPRVEPVERTPGRSAASWLREPLAMHRGRSGASTAARSGSPPKAGHHGWKEQQLQKGSGSGRKSPLMQAFSTAFHTAVVRVVRNRTDCADGSSGDDLAAAQVHEPDRRGSLAEHRLAQERVEVHARRGASARSWRAAPVRSCSR